MLTDQQRRMVAALAGVDTRTVERALEVGGAAKIRSASTRKAIVDALKELGHKHEAARVDRGRP